MVKEDRIVFEAVLAAQREGRPAALATVIETQGSVPRQSGSKMLVWPDGQIVGTIGGGEVEALAIREAQAALRDNQTRVVQYSLVDLAAGDPGVCGGTMRIFIEPLLPPPTILVIGCGHVGRAVAELAKWMEYRVVVADDRPGYATPGNIPNMDGYIEGPLAELPQRITINQHTYIAAVTRGVTVDEHMLPPMLATEAAYIGLIGSRRRWAVTMEKLAEQGISRAQLARIHAPIGLELGAETPKEIAISILAEIIMTMRGGTGKSMQWTNAVSEQAQQARE